MEKKKEDVKKSDMRREGKMNECINMKRKKQKRYDNKTPVSHTQLHTQEKVCRGMKGKMRDEKHRVGVRGLLSVLPVNLQK